jgi:Fic family protein
MSDLHVSYGNSRDLDRLLAAWDAQIGLEDPMAQHRWTDLSLWPAARNATVAGSTAIEGNPLTPAQVGEVLTGGQVEASRADVREVVNYNAALDLANRAALRPDFEWTSELIRRLNAAIMHDLDDDERGEYRRDPVTVGGVFHPPNWQQLPDLMSQLVDWLRHPTATHPLILAGLTHLNVVSIHPWLNGNGRAARVAGSLVLMRCGIGAPELLNVESEIRASRERYFAVLQETHGPTYAPDEHSATPWLEYFASICVNRLDARNRVLAALPHDIGSLFVELSREGHASPEWPAILLGARMAPVRTTRIAEVLGLSSGRARAMLSAMAASGWLVPIGERRGRRYGPSPRLMQLDLRTPLLMERVLGSAASEAVVADAMTPQAWTASRHETSTDTPPPSERSPSGSDPGR